MREHTDGEFPFANDFNAVVRDALAGSTLVESGCTVSDGGTNDLSLDVASGEVVVNGTHASVSSQSVTLASADADDPRYDLVVVDSSGSASDVTGTASSTPTAPSIPSDSALLAIVEVPAGASGVTDADVYDARAVLSGIPNSTVTQGSGSGLDADTLDGDDTPLPASAIDDGPGSGLDADTVDGREASELEIVPLQQTLSGDIHTTTNRQYGHAVNLSKDYYTTHTKYDPAGTITRTFTTITATRAALTGTWTWPYTGSSTAWLSVTISVNSSQVAKSSIYTQVNGTNASLSTATGVNVTPNDSLTFKVQLNAGGDGIMDATGTGPVQGSGTSTFTDVPTTSFTPAWVGYSGSTPNHATWNSTFYLDGSTVPQTEWGEYSITPGNSLTLRASWSGATTTTTWSGTNSIFGATYIR